MNIITARDKNEEGLKALLRAAATHEGAYGGHTLREEPDEDGALTFVRIGGIPTTSFTLRMKGKTIWASDHGFMFACSVLLTERIHFDWEERDFASKDEICEAFRATS
ncbi:MAG: hypothetical protein AAB367_01630 [Patescibacteria group bacterium]